MPSIEPITDLDFLPRVLPSGWVKIVDGHDGAKYSRNLNHSRLQVIASAARYDGKRWMHVSACRVSRHLAMTLPSWSELAEVKDVFIGAERKAIQVFPPRSQHVNLAEVLHLWSCLDDDGLPDFTGGRGTI